MALLDDRFLTTEEAIEQIYKQLGDPSDPNSVIGKLDSIEGSIGGSVQRILAFSTDTPLGGFATFTSSSIDALDYSKTTGRIVTDKKGTMRVYASDDNITFDQVFHIHINASYSHEFNVPNYGRYIKYEFENEKGTAQTIFRFSAYLD